MTDGSAGDHATPLDQGPGMPNILTDGPVVTQTLANLEQGLMGAPLSPSTLETIREQAQDLLTDVVQAYVNQVASGEVGAGGAARASESPPTNGRCPTGLLYGRVQSGKTNAMIVATAMAMDNGFRVVVVLTSNYVELVKQTANRFRALDGPLVYSSSSSSPGEHDWDADSNNIRANMGRHGVVLICAKNPEHQRSLVQFLQAVDAPNLPALILDDEADQATPDTTTNARAQQRASAPQQGSTTYRLTVENDASNEAGESIRETLRHNVFLQVTATPYALLLQNVESPLRPTFTRLLHPGAGYVGGERFFPTPPPQAGPVEPPLVLVDEAESGQLARRTAPEGLLKAVTLFLLAGAAHHTDTRQRFREGYKFLCHTSPVKADHDTAQRLIREHLDALGQTLPDLASPILERFQWAHAELRRTLPNIQPLDVLVRRVADRLRNRRILVVNSEKSVMEFGPDFNFLIGGNILGRGLTIENLLVTYYLRRARTSQMDTMLQHARMYGYRERLMPYTRAFLPPSLAVRFHQIHVAETALRELLAEPRTTVPVEVVGALNMRPARSQVLDLGRIGAYLPGQQVYPTRPAFTRELLGNSTERIDATLRDLCGVNWEQRKSAFIEVSIANVRSLLDQVRVDDDDPGEWDPPMLRTVLDAIATRYQQRALLYYRDFRKKTTFDTGALSGDEQREARRKLLPVFCLFRETGSFNSPNWDGVPWWYPTLLFPTNMPNQVFNTTA